MARERLDHGFSVFNSHINNAKARATAEFIAQFGQKAYDRHIKPFDDAGIMSIFEKRPGKYALAWVTLVTAYVNERFSCPARGCDFTSHDKGALTRHQRKAHHG